jgi:four helix bundle protein
MPLKAVAVGDSGAGTFPAVFRAMTKAWDLRERTTDFAAETFRFCRTLPKDDEARDIVRQLRRAASSVAANCRAMRRSQSDPVFASKVAVIIEEADESGFWLEFIVRIELAPQKAVSGLLAEANELVAIFTASRKTVCARLESEKSARKASGLSKRKR